MTDKLTVKMTRWPATGYGLVVGFAAASQAPCQSAEDYEHATECRDALRAYKRARKPALDALGKMDFFEDDAAFDAAALALDDDGAEVLLTPKAFKWLRGKLDAQQSSGAFAATRQRLTKSLDAAKEEDVEVKT